MPPPKPPGSQHSGPKPDDADTRVSPDPFAVVLPAVAALGAVASIAAVNWVAQERTPERTRSKRRSTVALRDFESCCMGLTEIFRRFQRNPRLFAGGGAAQTTPMKFGVHGPRITPDEARLYQQLINDTASMLVLAAQNAYDVMAAIEDGELEPPEDVFYRLADAQDRLNQLVQQRASLKQTVDSGAEIAAELTSLVKELKSYRVGQGS